MPPRFVQKNAGSTAQKKTATKASSKFSKTPPKSVSSAPPKAEPETVEKTQSKPSPIVETLKVREEAIKPCKDLNEASVKAQTEKEIHVEDADGKDKESTEDADKPSAQGIEEDGKRKDIEKKESDTVMHEAHDNEGNDTEHHDELFGNEQTHGNEEGVEGDRADDVDMPGTVKERIKQKEFEVFVGGLDKDADEEDLKKVFSEIGEVVDIKFPKNS